MFTLSCGLVVFFALILGFISADDLPVAFLAAGFAHGIVCRAVSSFVTCAAVRAWTLFCLHSLDGINTGAGQCQFLQLYMLMSMRVTTPYENAAFRGKGVAAPSEKTNSFAARGSRNFVKNKVL